MPNPRPLYASDLGMWQCPRSLYYSATMRHLRPDLDEETKDKLDYYSILETLSMDRLKKHNWNIIQPEKWAVGVPVKKQDQPLFIYKDDEGNEIMRGRVDLIAAPPGVEIAGLFDIKTSNTHVFERTDSLHSLMRAKHWWSGQVAQWVMYMYMSGRDYGGIIQFDRDTGRNQIHFGSIVKGHKYYDKALDAFSQDVINNVDIAWTGARLGVEPDYCDNLTLCRDCWCKGASICSPPIENRGIETALISATSADDVESYLKLKPIKRDFERLKNSIEEPLKHYISENGNPEKGFIIGDGRYIAKASIATTTRYEYPEAIKQQYRVEDGQRVTIKIEPIEGDDDDEQDE